MFLAFRYVALALRVVALALALEVVALTLALGVVALLTLLHFVHPFTESEKS